MKTITHPADRTEARRIIEDLLGAEGGRQLASEVLDVLAERGCGWQMAATALASLSEDELGAVIGEAEERIACSEPQLSPEAKRLDAQWPKRCGCGRAWAIDGTFFDWKCLPLATNQRAPDGRYTDAFATSELRNCVCGSTLMALVEIHDISEE